MVGVSVGSISVADVRPALMRSGIDTSSGVAIAIFGSLQDQPRTNIDFAQFQRIAHAITSSAAAAPPVPGTMGGASAARPGSAPTPSALGTAPLAHAAAPTSAYPPKPAYPPTSGYPAAYPPGYQPTDIGGNAPPTRPEALGSSYSPHRASAASATRTGGTPPGGGGLSAEEARRLGRRPTTSPGGTADPYHIGTAGRIPSGATAGPRRKL